MTDSHPLAESRRQDPLPEQPQAQPQVYMGFQQSPADVRRITTTLPIGPGTRAVVVSRVVPATTFGSLAAAGQSPGDRIAFQGSERYKHVSDLAQVTLANARGQTLFSGLHHTLFHADELTGELLARLSAGERKSLIGDLLFTEGSPKLVGQSRQQRIDWHCLDIDAGPQQAESNAAKIRQAASRLMARETATAALVANPGNLQRALCGETVNVNLFAVCLLSSGELETGGHQRYALYQLMRQSPLVLQLRGQDGRAHSVRANVHVRQFLLPGGVGQFSQPAQGIPYHENVRLLGAGLPSQAGGALKARLNALQIQIENLRSEFIALEQEYVQATRRPGADEAALFENRSRQSALLNDTECLEKNRRTLDEAGKQLNTLWARARDWPTGYERHCQAAARLSLVGHLMGETPVLSCARGKSLTAQLEAEINFLATVADNQNGFLPSIDTDTPAWEQVRDAFKPQ